MKLNTNKLDKIKINGYKSIKKCELELGDINVLIGSNGAGKSNFISSFALLQSILNKNLQLSVGQSGLNSLFYNGTKVTDEIMFEVLFGDNKYSFELMPTDDNRIMFKSECFDSKSLDEPAQLNGHFESNSQNTEPLSNQNWRVYHFHDTSRNAKVKQEHNISNNKILLNDAGNLGAFLYRIKNHYNKSYINIVKTIQLIAPYFNDFVLEPQEGNSEQIVLKWKQKNCEDIFNASQFSDGTLRFICLATLLLQPSELQPSTIIVDEPELGLHPYAITIFAELVREISFQKQIIISTQSVDMLNEFDVEDIVVVDRNKDGSLFKRLNEDELSNWLNNDYALGDLWKKNVLGGRLS